MILVQYTQSYRVERILIHVFSSIGNIIASQYRFTYRELSIIFRSKVFQGLPLILAVSLMLNLELLSHQTFLQLLESEAVLPLCFFLVSTRILLEEGDAEFKSSNHRPLLWVRRGKIVFGHFKCQYFALTDPYYPKLLVGLGESNLKV